ncbi:hypothetical protein RhiirC2_789208 [Rhizophagus irregularis]|uniref:Uncharacterized protein n=1 Tax=Rhizophagus irregularis TaxID=588596 RepID=A0A2N1MNL2_9GLOM|nr:hypothetical protein RhiirC2_789208 [Rhizophagus irregularis]
MSAIHNHFIQKFKKKIWKPHSYNKSKWKDTMNITQKIKLSSRPSNLPKSMYLPFSTLPLPTLSNAACDPNVDYFKELDKICSINKFNKDKDYYAMFAIMEINSLPIELLEKIIKSVSEANSFLWGEYVGNISENSKWMRQDCGCKDITRLPQYSGI